jgi:hypothetical protein
MEAIEELFIILQIFMDVLKVEFFQFQLLLMFKKLHNLNSF